MSPLSQQQRVECAVALLHSLKAIEMEQVLAKLLSEQPDYRLLPLLSAVLEKLTPEQNHELLSSLLGALHTARVAGVLRLGRRHVRGHLAPHSDPGDSQAS